MTPRQEVMAILAEVGGEFFDSSRYQGELLGTAWTPAGFAWRATGCHVVSVGFHTDRPAGWRYLLDDLRKGTEPCDQTDCDTCAEDAAL